MTRCYWDPVTGRVKAIKDTPDAALDKSWPFLDLPPVVDDIARIQNDLRRATAAYVRYNPDNGNVVEITFDGSISVSNNLVSCPRPLAERIVTGHESASNWVCGLDENYTRVLKPVEGALRTRYVETNNFISVSSENKQIDVKLSVSIGKDGSWEVKLISRWDPSAIELPTGSLTFAITAPDDPALLLAIFSVPYEEIAAQEPVRGTLDSSLPDDFAVRVKALEPNIYTYLIVAPVVAKTVPLPPRPFEDLVRLERTERLQEDNALVAQPVSRGIRLHAAAQADRYDRVTDRVSVMVTPRGNPGVLLHTIEAPIEPLLAGDEVVIPLSPRWLGDEYDLWTQRLWVNARRIDLKRKWTKSKVSD